jgi:DNA-binding MarR family transcriptional regulator
MPSPRRAVSNLDVGACACFRVRSAARAITEFYDAALEPAEIRLTQMAILSVIASGAGTTMQDVAKQLGLDPSTMTRTLRPLEVAKLVRVRAGSDRRAKEMELTSAGKKALAEAGAYWADAQRTLREKVGRNVFDRLLGDLSTVMRTLKRKRVPARETR